MSLWTCPDCGGDLIVVEDMHLYCAECENDVHEDETPEANYAEARDRQRSVKRAEFFNYYGSSAAVRSLTYGRASHGRTTCNFLEIEKVLASGGEVIVLAEKDVESIMRGYADA